MKKTNLAKLTKHIKALEGESFTIRVSGYKNLNTLKMALERNGYVTTNRIGKSMFRCFKDYALDYENEQICPFYVEFNKRGDLKWDRESLKLVHFKRVEFTNMIFPNEPFMEGYINFQYGRSTKKESEIA
jgi:hypothetical protein